MKLTLMIGPEERAAMRWRTVLQEKEAALQAQGICAPAWNHVRLYAACARVEEVGVLRHKRGLASIYAQACLGAEWTQLLAQEVPLLKGDHVVLAATQLGQLLCHGDEIARLAALLRPHFSEIRIVAHIRDQARALIRHYTQTLIEGRRHPLNREIALAQGTAWWDAAMAQRGDTEPHFGLFNDVQTPPPWLDYAGLLRLWEQHFDDVALCPLDMESLASAEAMGDLCAALDLPDTFGPVKPARLAAPEPAAALTRMRHMNEAMVRYAQARDVFIPYDMRLQVLKAVRIDGPPPDPGSLFALSDHFAPANARLVQRFPDLATALAPAPRAEPWQEADPERGFRATQYLAALVYAIDKQAIPLAQKRAEAETAKKAAQVFDRLVPATDADAAQLLTRIKFNHEMILSSPFRPHNQLGSTDEEASRQPYAPSQTNPRSVIVGCMKNEAPYILEWIAYHRAIGIEQFVIYTNDCDDGTDTILQRLEEMGVLQHRNNNRWKGNSPQQHALNQALKEPVVQNAEWLIHIDVDEFINIRTGNGTLGDLIAAVPDATNIAMTWRLFGHDGTADLHDSFVIDQFETCAPKFCPKPHNVWGFKTMFRNTGAYAKMSAHRPNKLNNARAGSVKWVNGSGEDITEDLLRNGWRSSKSNIGYDLVQLNHYALRSAASFLIKRQRGRALHVDRTIGINYWIRMDWSDARDITIKRNIPRLQAEVDRLLRDPALRAAHEKGRAWHAAKAEDLKAIPEFSDLFDRALTLKLNAAERAAYALALDMES